MGKTLTSHAVRLSPLWFGLMAVALLVTRLPMTLLTNFWAEDGAVFYTQAYMLGALQALLIPNAGYLQTFPRLEAALAVQFPLVYGPMLATVTSLVFDALPGAFLLSNRFAHLAPWPVRLAVALASVVIPASFELNGNLANVQWHLALLVLLLLVARPPRTRPGQVLDLSGLVLGGLSGPFSLVLGPLAVWQAQCGRTSWALVRAAALGTTAAIQAVVVVANFHQRSSNLNNLGASTGRLVRLLDRPLLTPLLGDRAYTQLYTTSAWDSPLVPTLVLAVGAIVVTYAFWRGPMALRLLLLLAGGVLVMTVVSPVGAIQPEGFWATLARGGISMRYFYIPELAWVVVLIWLACQTSVLRFAAVGLLLYGAVVAVPTDWRYPDLRVDGFQAAARRFDHAAPGTIVTLPIEIPGFTMTLHRR